MELPIDKPHLSAKERLVQLLNGGIRDVCLVNYDMFKCPNKKDTFPRFNNPHNLTSSFNESSTEETRILFIFMLGF